MTETIPGGKYLAADGETFIDAWGKPIEVAEETVAKQPEDPGNTEDATAKLARLSRADLETMAVEAGMSAEDAKAAQNREELAEFIVAVAKQPEGE